MKTLLTLLALTLLLSACTDNDAERQAEAQAALEATRPEYEAREAVITSALKQASGWRTKTETPALAWGDRPAAKFLDARYDKYANDTNGRIFELTAGGEFNTDGSTLLGLFIDESWPRDIKKLMEGGHVSSEGAVTNMFERYKQVRYLCLLITDEYRDAEFGEGSLFSIKFTPAQWRGRALYFDLDQGGLIGGKLINVQNPDKLDFKTSGFEKDEQRKAAETTAEEDIRKRIIDACMTP